MKTARCFTSRLAQFFLEWELFHTQAVEKIKTHISWSMTILFLKSYLIRDYVTIWRMHLACLITKATHIHTLPTNYCFSTTSMVARTHHKATSYVHFLSGWCLECSTVRSYELYTVLTDWIMALCVITTCCLVGSRQSFWETCCVHLNLL